MKLNINENSENYFCTVVKIGQVFDIPKADNEFNLFEFLYSNAALIIPTEQFEEFLKGVKLYTPRKGEVVTIIHPTLNLELKS